MRCFQTSSWSVSSANKDIYKIDSNQEGINLEIVKGIYNDVLLFGSFLFVIFSFVLFLLLFFLSSKIHPEKYFDILKFTVE